MRGDITDIKFSGDKFNVTGNISGNSSLTVKSVQDENIGSGKIYNTGRISGNDVTLVTNGNLDQEGNIIGYNSLSIKSNSLDNVYYIYGASLNIESNYVRNRATIDGNTTSITAGNGIFNEGQISANGDMNLNTKYSANITNYNTIKAGGTLTMTARNVKNGGYRCGFMGLASCGVGSISTNKLVLNSYHDYSYEMGGRLQFKYAEVNSMR